MKNYKILSIIANALYLIATLIMLFYLILDMETYHAPKIYFTIGLILMLLGSILAIITSILKRRRSK